MPPRAIAPYIFHFSLGKMMISTVLRRSAALRRVLTTTNVGRKYHVSATLSADALDMADSFSRRHRKYGWRLAGCAAAFF